VQQLQTFLARLAKETRNPRHVSAGPCKAGHEANLHRIEADVKEDGNRLRRRFGGKRCRRTSRDNHSHIEPNQISSQSWQPVDAILCPTSLDRHVSAFDVAGFSKAAEKGSTTFGLPCRRLQNSDNR
jgi:hypothetical protein